MKLMTIDKSSNLKASNCRGGGGGFYLERGRTSDHILPLGLDRLEAVIEDSRYTVAATHHYRPHALNRDVQIAHVKDLLLPRQLYCRGCGDKGNLVILG